MAKVLDPKAVKPVLPVAGLAVYVELYGSFQGEDAKGFASLPGAKVGDIIREITRRDYPEGEAVPVAQDSKSEVEVEAPDGSDSFESVISVADQIEQYDDADLSGSVFTVLLLRKKEPASVLKLDGTEKLAPVPFNAHELIVRDTHTHSIADGYQPVPRVGEYVPQEFPKAITVGEGDDAHTVIAKDAEHESQLKGAVSTPAPNPAGSSAKPAGIPASGKGK